MMKRFCLAIFVFFWLVGEVRAQDVHVLPLPSAATLDADVDILALVPIADVEALRVQAEALAARNGVTFVADWPLVSIGVHCIILRAPDMASRAAALAAIAAESNVFSAQPVQTFELAQAPPGDAVATRRSNLQDVQEALQALNVAKAHRYATGNGIRIGVIDSAIDAEHPDLGTGRVLTRDFVASEAEGGIATTVPPEGHGTAVAGVIAANGARRGGLMGVAPDARLIGLRACWQTAAESRCNSFSIARALNYAVIQRIPLLNLSIAGPEDPLISALIDMAVAQGTIIVASEATAGPFPASHASVIRARPEGTESAFPGSLSVPAPAFDILSTAPNGSYDFFSGASIAAAHVSGVAALILESSPQQSLTGVRLKLDRAVDAERSALPMLDACRAVAPPEADCDAD